MLVRVAWQVTLVCMEFSSLPTSLKVRPHYVAGRTRIRRRPIKYTAAHMRPDERIPSVGICLASTSAPPAHIRAGVVAPTSAALERVLLARVHRGTRGQVVEWRRGFAYFHARLFCMQYAIARSFAGSCCFDEFVGAHCLPLFYRQKRLAFHRRSVFAKVWLCRVGHSGRFGATESANARLVGAGGISLRPRNSASNPFRQK